MRKTLTLLFNIFLGCCAFFSSHAELISYEAVNHQFYYSFNISGITSNPGGEFSNRSSSSYIRVTLDTDAMTLAVDEISVQFNDASLQFTENATIGFGQSANLRFNLQARPFGFKVLNGAPVSLTPSSDGNFTAPGFTTAESVAFDPIIVDYTIIGPTSTVSGQSSSFTFSQIPHYATLDVGGTLNTSGFPDVVILDQIVINAASPTPAGEMINFDIEGGRSSFSLSLGYFNIDPDLGPFDGSNRIVLTRLVPSPTPSPTPSPFPTPQPTSTPSPSPSATPTSPPPAPPSPQKDREPPGLTISGGVIHITQDRSLFIGGSAWDDRKIKEVVIQKQGSRRTIRAHGTTEWYANLHLDLGVNVFRLTAVDKAGNRSKTRRIVIVRAG